VLIGDGVRFFEGLDRDVARHLVGVKAFRSGMVALTHEVQPGRPGASASTRG